MKSVQKTFEIENLLDGSLIEPIRVDFFCIDFNGNTSVRFYYFQYLTGLTNSMRLNAFNL